MTKTPLMARVVPGTEPKILGKAMWDCRAPAAKGFEPLLNSMGKYAYESDQEQSQAYKATLSHPTSLTMYPLYLGFRV